MVMTAQELHAYVEAELEKGNHVFIENATTAGFFGQFLSNLKNVSRLSIEDAVKTTTGDDRA